MSFNATQWRDLIADYSGSQSGTRSWGVLGQCQYQGQYYIQAVLESNKLKTRIRGCGGGIGKNVLSFYSVSATARAYSTYFNAYYGYFNFTYYQTGTLYSTPAYVYYLGTNISGLTNTSYVGYSNGNSTYWSVQGVNGINGTTYVAFYSYTPWGAPPYSAGSNIAIGHGNQGSPTSGYPYQRYYLSCP